MADSWTTRWRKYLAARYARRYWYKHLLRINDSRTMVEAIRHIYETGFNQGVAIAYTDESFRSSGEDPPEPPKVERKPLALVKTARKNSCA